MNCENSLSLSLQIKESISWLGFSAASLFLIRLVFLLLVANALPVTMFGSYGILVAIAAFLPAVLQSTFQAKIIHSQVKDYKYNRRLHNAFLKISIAYSLFCMLVFQFVSDLAMELGLWLPILLLINVLKLLETVPISLLHRELDFRKIGRIRIGKLLIFGISATCIYVYQVSIAVLIVPELLACVYGYGAAMKYLRSDSACTGSLSYESGKKFGWNGFAANLSNYLANQSGTVYLAFFYGLGPAGAFFLAKRLHDAMITLIDTIHLEGIFPIFAKKWEGGSGVDFESMAAYTNGRAALLVPLLTIIFWNSGSLFLWMEQDGLSSAVVVFQLLLVPQILRYSIFPANKIFYSIGRPNLSAQVSIGRMILFGISFLLCWIFNLDVTGLVLILVSVEIIILLSYQVILWKLTILPVGVGLNLFVTIVLAFTVLLVPTIFRQYEILNQDLLLWIYWALLCLLLSRFTGEYKVIFNKIFKRGLRGIK